MENNEKIKNEDTENTDIESENMENQDVENEDISQENITETKVESHETEENIPGSDVENHKTKEKDESLQDFNDIPKTVSDIEQEKKNFKNGDIKVKGNEAQNLFIFQNAIINGGISSGNYTVREVLQDNNKIDKDYDLSSMEQFAEFGETFKVGEQFAIAIILCVFEYVELNDLKDLKSKLLKELPKMKTKKGKEIEVFQDAYVSVNTLLKTIRGEVVVLENGGECVRLGEKRSKALKNLWQQFPELRESIARWLLNVCDSFEYRTNFDTVQITTAFVNIMKLDFNAGVSCFFSRLYSKPDKYWLLGFIALELYNDSKCKNKILPYVNKWVESYNSWLWKCALYVYVNKKSDEQDNEFDKKIQKLLEKWYDLHQYDDLSYIGTLLTVSEQLRDHIAVMFKNILNKTYNYNERRLSCLYYLEFLRYEYYLVSDNMVDLPLVTCDKKQQLIDLLPLLESVLTQYDTRRYLFITLESYIKEISEYHVEKRTINHLKAFFQILSQRNMRFHNDIRLFLKKCECSLSKQLQEFLDEVLPSL